MTESICNSKGEIFKFERHYLELVLKERLEKEEEILKEMEASEWIKDPMSKAALPLFKIWTGDLRIVLARLQTTPVVEGPQIRMEKGGRGI